METVIIGLGGFGMNLINDIQSDVESNISTIVVAKNDILENSNALQKIELDDEALKKIKDIVSKYKNIIVANGLGGDSSKKLMQLVDMLNKKNLEVIVNKPFSWEGEEKNRLSESIISKLIDKYIDIKIFDNNMVTKFTEQNKSINEAFSSHHKAIGEYIIYKYVDKNSEK